MVVIKLTTMTKKKKIIIGISCGVVAALIIAGVLTWYFLCAQIQGIFISTLPVKTSYYVGEELDTTGLGVMERKRIQSYNSEVELDDVEITGFDSSTPCERQEIVVSYSNFTASFFVEIKEIAPPQKSVIKIQLIAEEGYEIKTTYYVFEPLEIEHMRLLVTYSDYSTEVIPIEKEYVSGYDNREPAENLEVRFTYGNFFTRLYVTILQTPQAN